MLLPQLIQHLGKELSFYRRLRTLTAYHSLLRSIQSMTGKDIDLDLNRIFTPEWLYKYQLFLTDKGLKRNTIAFYMRILRAIYNKAVDARLCLHVPRLFFNVYTGMDATNKRAVGPAVINRIEAATDLPGTLEFCRDIFLLCFYLQGMTFVDLAYLRKHDLQDGYIVYRRRKSKSEIVVKVSPQARKILKKYASQTIGTDYLFPIITDNEKCHYKQYQSALRSQNRNLKKLADKLGINETLSTYVARHSWATMAYRNGVPVAAISEAMGHKTEEMTRVYLASLGKETIDKANKTVLEALKREKGREKGREEGREEKRMSVF